MTLEHYKAQAETARQFKELQAELQQAISERDAARLLCERLQAQADEMRSGWPVPIRYTNDGSLAECPCCGSLDVGGAQDTVHCYGCGLTITKPRPLQNACDAWNMRGGNNQTAASPTTSGDSHD